MFYSFIFLFQNKDFYPTMPFILLFVVSLKLLPSFEFFLFSSYIRDEKSPSKSYIDVFYELNLNESPVNDFANFLFKYLLKF
jgi:hypothetical protein